MSVKWQGGFQAQTVAANRTGWAPAASSESWRGLRRGRQNEHLDAVLAYIQCRQRSPARSSNRIPRHRTGQFRQPHLVSPQRQSRTCCWALQRIITRSGPGHVRITTSFLPSAAACNASSIGAVFEAFGISRENGFQNATRHAVVDDSPSSLRRCVYWRTRRNTPQVVTEHDSKLRTHQHRRQRRRLDG